MARVPEPGTSESEKSLQHRGLGRVGREAPCKVYKTVLQAWGILPTPPPLVFLLPKTP